MSLEFCLRKRGTCKMPRAFRIKRNDFQLGNIWETSFEAGAFTYLKGSSDGGRGAGIGGSNSLSAHVEKGKVTMYDALRIALYPTNALLVC